VLGADTGRGLRLPASNPTPVEQHDRSTQDDHSAVCSGVDSQQKWIRDDVVLPFVFTRFALVIAGWFSQYFPLNTHYPSAIAVTRGWHFSAHRLVDIWGRWDAGWYLSIVFDGYRVRGDIQTTQSNIAFFPMYPYLVKSLVQLLPAQYRTLGAALFIGVVLSNVLLLAAMILLRELVASLTQDEAAARRSVLYMLFFPTSFFLSCFYTESLFLFLSIAAFYAARKQAWAATSVIGALLALTRPIGVLIVIPLLWVYLESHGGSSVPPSGHRLVHTGADRALTYLLSVYHLTDNLLAPLQIQTAWGKAFVAPMLTLLTQTFLAYVTPVEQVFVAAFVLLGWHL
jgi:hypothetical protein